MESTSDKVAKLVAQSEIANIQEQIWAQHKTIMFLEERVIAFERLVQGYTNVTKDLAKEIKFAVAEHNKVALVRRSKCGRYGRREGEVAKRWAEWKALEESGKTIYQIAEIWKVDHSTVAYAKKKGYSNAKSLLPASLIGHEIVSLPPTRKGHRKHRNRMQLRLAA